VIDLIIWLPLKIEKLFKKNISKHKKILMSYSAILIWAAECEYRLSKGNVLIDSLGGSIVVGEARVLDFWWEEVIVNDEGQHALGALGWFTIITGFHNQLATSHIPSINWQQVTYHQSTGNKSHTINQLATSHVPSINWQKVTNHQNMATYIRSDKVSLRWCSLHHNVTQKWLN